MDPVSRWAGRTAAAALLLAALGCASSPGARVVHPVKPGETVYRIARYYDVSVRDVVRANRIRDVTEISIGSRLRIPGARRKPPSHALPGPSVHVVSSATPVSARRLGHVDLDWPVRGSVSSGFGRRRGRPHEGIDIPARRGTPIRAAEAGRVVHSGSGLGDYGTVVILKHAGPYLTVYAHNRRNRVRKGEFVEKGEVIAEVGSTGNASGPHVHFEVRDGHKPLNPLAYLP